MRYARAQPPPNDVIEMWPFKPPLAVITLGEWRRWEVANSFAWPPREDREAWQRAFDQWVAFKESLWRRHLAQLSRRERREKKAGIHPSQSHAFVERARPFVARLGDFFAVKGIGSVWLSLGNYHLDRLVLTACLPAGLAPEKWDEVPYLFRGFEVKSHEVTPDDLAALDWFGRTPPLQ